MKAQLQLGETRSLMTAKDVVAAIRTAYAPRYNWEAPEWVVFDEVRVAPGFAKDADQRLDVWAMNCWPSKRACVAYEVKVSRSDFLQEMKKPQKRRYALLYSNQFYFAAPTGLIRPDELPPEAGLVEVNEEGNLVVAVHAPWRDCYPPSWGFVASLCRRILKEGAD